MFKHLFILTMLAAAPAGAQQMYLGAEAGPDVFNKAEEVKLNQQDEDVFAKAFVLENSTAALYSVFDSTTPAQAAASFMRQGIYRAELLVLFSIARDSKTSFKELAKERDKGVTLRTIAENKKADLMKLFREADELQKRIEIRAAFIDISTAAFVVETSSAPAEVPASSVPVAGTPAPAVKSSTAPAAGLPVENEKK